MRPLRTWQVLSHQRHRRFVPAVSERGWEGIAWYTLPNSKLHAASRERKTKKEDAWIGEVRCLVLPCLAWFWLCHVVAGVCDVGRKGEGERRGWARWYQGQTV